MLVFVSMLFNMIGMSVDEPGIDNRTYILYNKVMTVWQHIQTALGGAASRQMAGELVRAIETQAAREGLPPDELTLLLLSQGLEARHETQRVHHAWQSLSRREKQVAALICQGFTSRQIAARLVLSPETIKTHVRHILRKFGLHSRRDLCQALEGWSFDQVRE